ncbi:MAG: acyl-CoA thioesterase [Thermodesulfovibrionales bacterium]
MKQHDTRLTVRFSEVDSFGVVWHGHYINYFEQGRLDLTSRFGLSPEDLRGLGLFAPVVDIRCRLRSPARFPDVLTIGTTVKPSEKAMLTFAFRLMRDSDGALLAEGETSHVLLTLSGTMLYEVPTELKHRIDAMLDSLHG